MPKYEKVQVDFHGWNIQVPVIPNLAQLILEQVEKKPERFDMGSWHGTVADADDDITDTPKPEDYEKCGTTHCVAGWAVVVAGKAGIELEKKLFTEEVASMLFEHSALGEPFENFYGTSASALEELRDYAAREADVIASQELDGKVAR